MLRSGVHLADFQIKGPMGLRRLVNSICRLSQELERGAIFAGGDAPEEWHIVQIKAISPNIVWIDGLHVELNDNQYALLCLLARHRNRPVHREEMKKLLWPDTKKHSQELNRPLNNHLDRLRKAIREQTGRQIDPDKLICGKAKEYKIHWLQALVEET